MTAATRGSWELDEAIVALWASGGLDAIFRAEWSTPTDTTHSPLNDSEARPSTPTPYCVFERERASNINHSSGKTISTAIQYWTVRGLFRIHARSTATESGKSIAKRMVAAVAAVFDPPAKLNMTNDKWISTIRGPDFPVREGDDEWAWVLTYDWRLEGYYNVAVT